MLRPLLATAVLACTLIGVALCGCETIRPMPARGTAAADNALAAEVQNRLAFDEVVRGHTIAVDAKNGVVTLTGLPSDPGSRARALSIARGTPGVRMVTND